MEKNTDNNSQNVVEVQVQGVSISGKVKLNNDTNRNNEVAQKETSGAKNSTSK